MVTNTNVAATPLYPCGLGTNKGYVLGYIDSGAKAAQSDTWTVKNAKAVTGGVLLVWGTLDATGAAEPYTLGTTTSGNIITLTGATGTACSAMILYLPA